MTLIILFQMVIGDIFKPTLQTQLVQILPQQIQQLQTLQLIKIHF